MTDASADPLGELLALKDEALEATARGDGDFFSSYLADDVMALTPTGMLDKAAIVSAMTNGAPFHNTGVDRVQAAMITPDVGLVTYYARFARQDGSDTLLLTSTLYRRTATGWQGVFYQQTPVIPSQQASFR